MSTHTSSSEQVIEDDKKHRLARGVLRHIQVLMRGFEQCRALDLRLGPSVTDAFAEQLI